MCTPALARSLREPVDLLRAPLLRSYRPQDWTAWFRAAGLENNVVHGPMFDSSLIMVHAALRGEGVALAPSMLFRRELESGQLVRPFAIEAEIDGYWLTRLKSRPPSGAMIVFRDWLIQTFADGLDMNNQPALSTPYGEPS